MCSQFDSVFFPSGLYATVGCHPTRSTEFDKYRGGPEAYLQDLDNLIGSNLKGTGRVVAIGECGLGSDLHAGIQTLGTNLIIP
jgi:Tat protein secretion system quality control protein TatD with DNase activity